MRKHSLPIIFGYVLISGMSAHPLLYSQESGIPFVHNSSSSSTEALPAEFAGNGNSPEVSSGDSAGTPAFVRSARPLKRPDFNRDIYYRNKVEFSFETGWLPNNIPFLFDMISGQKWNVWPLHYTLVPNIASIRWHLDNIWGRSVFRGNTDFSFSGSYTAIPRGAETRYFAYNYGIRHNFVQPRWRIVPYFEGRGGIGNINAKGPRGVEYAQGQDMTFTLMMGSGARYNFNPKYSVAAGATYMHVSNLYMSEPKVENIGINVWGSMIGIYVRLGKPKPSVFESPR